MKNKKLTFISTLFMGLLLGGCASPEAQRAHAAAVDVSAESPPPIETPTAHATLALSADDEAPDWFDYQPNIDLDSRPLGEILETWDHETEAVVSVEESEGEIDDQVDDNLWDHLRDGFALADTGHPRIDAEIKWFTRHQNYLGRVAKQAEPYLHYIVEQVDARGMPREIALLPVVESAFQPYAYSPGRAAGLWQFIPATAQRFGLRLSWWYDGRRDVIASTDAALEYLDHLHDLFDGDWLLALAAYNSGEGTVQRAIRKNQRRGKPTDYWSLPLPRETKAYVPRLLAVSAVVAEPHAHGIALTPIANEPYLATVDVGTQIDLRIAAQLADMDMNELYRLNPGFNRGATDPAGPHYLALPIDRAAAFEARLSELPDDQRVQWLRHRVRNGETLSHIAARYRTDVSHIKALNHLKGTTIRAGRYLLVPMTSLELAGPGARRDSGVIDHTIARGDTLWDIARKYEVSVKQLTAWNDISPGKHLRPGRTLRLHTAAGNDPRVGGPPRVERKITYTVRRGDSLARISKRFNVSVNQLVRWNGLNKHKYLKPGQRLKVIVDVTRVAESS